MILHLFNSSIVSGPEKLVIPALTEIPEARVLFLLETRINQNCQILPIDYALSHGLNVDLLKVESRLDLKTIKKLSDWFFNNSPKIVHAHDVKATLYALLAKIYGKHNFILCSTHHGIFGRPDWKSKFYERIYRHLVLPFCNIVFAVSKSDYSVLSKNIFLKNKLKLHYNGVNLTSVTSYNRQQIREELGLNNNNFALCWIGRLSTEKQPQLVIESFKILLNNLQSALSDINPTLHIYGDGVLRSEIEKLVVQYNLQKYVKILGYDADIMSKLAAYDLLVNTSKSEGLPISILEAAHLEVPVLAPQIGGIPDLITNSRYGYTIPERSLANEYAAMIFKIIKDEKERKSRAKALKIRVNSDFSGKRWVEDLIKFYGDFALLRNKVTLQ